MSLSPCTYATMGKKDEEESSTALAPIAHPLAGKKLAKRALRLVKKGARKEIILIFFYQLLQKRAYEGESRKWGNQLKKERKVLA